MDGRAKEPHSVPVHGGHEAAIVCGRADGEIDGGLGATQLCHLKLQHNPPDLVSGVVVSADDDVAQNIQAVEVHLAVLDCPASLEDDVSVGVGDDGKGHIAGRCWGHVEVCVRAGSEWGEQRGRGRGGGREGEKERGKRREREGGKEGGRNNCIYSDQYARRFCKLSFLGLVVNQWVPICIP